MTDKELKQLEQRFLAGETSLDEEKLLARTLRTHVCTTDDERALKEMLAWIDNGLPTDGEKNIYDKAQAKPAPHGRKTLTRLLLTAVAAAVALLLVIMPWGYDGQDLTADNTKTPQAAQPTTAEQPTGNRADTIRKASPTKTSGKKKRRKAVFRITPPKVYLAKEISDSARQAAEQRVDAMIAEIRMQEIEFIETLNEEYAEKNKELDGYLAAFNDDDFEEESYTIY